MQHEMDGWMENQVELKSNRFELKRMTTRTKDLGNELDGA